jgi:hypothetical protein
MSKLNQISNRNSINGSDIRFKNEETVSDEINKRINQRYKPDSLLQPNFDPRPVSTKYALFPIIDRRTTSNVMKQKYDSYSPSQNFNPGNDGAPVNGFLDNIGIESELRGNNYKLAGGDLGHKFFPSRDGPLYNNVVGNPLETPDPKHNLLFKKNTYVQSNSIDPSIGRDIFHNNTRVQLRNT